jgi:hypothetical protein
MHEERRGPFFKEKYVDDEAALDTCHQPPIPRPPTLHANALPVMTRPPLPPPPSQRQQPNPKHRRSLTFEEEFVMVLREIMTPSSKGRKKVGG